MTNEQLANQAQTGSRAALTELWGAVRPLLFSLAWKFYSRQGKERCSSHGVTLEDLQQEAFFALCDAVGAFDEGKGYHSSPPTFPGPQKTGSGPAWASGGREIP